MKSPVYFIDFRASFKENILGKLERLLGTAGMEKYVKPKDLVAVKLHFGESGNTAYIRPIYIRKIVEILKKMNAKPFITDANTLYSGTRSDAPGHLTTAIQNGFSYATVEAPLIIADGLRGRSETVIEIGKKHFKSIYVGNAVMEADSVVCISHFKGHEFSGFGGSLKNIGMGGASRRGKMAQHASMSPLVKKNECVGCGECIEHCSMDAILLSAERAHINPERCVGCGECVLVCTQEAIKIQWEQSIPVFMERMMEYAYGICREKKDKIFFVNLIADVSPACDCYGFNDSPVVRNIGIVASHDPVAIDQASIDLVNAEPALADSYLAANDINNKPGQDKFKGLYPKVDWQIQLSYAQELGIGSREYELKKI